MDISAHGLGGAKNLPISPELAIAGASAALTVSFIVLALAWRTPRFDAATQGRPAPAWLSGMVSTHPRSHQPYALPGSCSSATSPGRRWPARTC